jgi:hypothetical protein
VRRSTRCISICLFTAAACGPFVTGDGPADQGASASGASPSDGGAAQDNGAGPELDGGPSGAEAEDGGSPPQMFTAYDLKVEGLSGDVVYAHRIKSKDVRYDHLVMIAESDLPEPGDQDVVGGVVCAVEVHVHDAEAKWVRAGTLYVHKLETK